MSEITDENGDLRTLLEYCFKDELSDYVDRCREDGVDLGPENDAKPWEDAAAKDDTHIFGAIVRLGREYCGWDQHLEGGT